MIRMMISCQVKYQSIAYGKPVPYTTTPYDIDAGAGVIVLLAQILKHQDGTQIATRRALRLQL